jgi:hypothetical protein
MRKEYEQKLEELKRSGEEELQVGRGVGAGVAGATPVVVRGGGRWRLELDGVAG